MSITPVYQSHKTLNYTDCARLAKLCTHVDDWYLLAIGNYIESTTIEREILRQLLLINGYKFLAQHLHPLLSNSFRAVSTFVWEVHIKTRDTDSGCTPYHCWLLTVDCRRRGQKNENCANYWLRSWFDFTPDFRGADFISFRHSRNWYEPIANRCLKNARWIRSCFICSLSKTVKSQIANTSFLK